LRVVRRAGFAVVLLIAGSAEPRHAKANGDTRTISLHHVHTNENLTITYKKNGQIDEQALKKINWIMRDWRKNQDVAMDAEAIDMLWEVHREVGATDPIHIICGYRSPDTNTMLRSRSKGVARFSQHTLGKAIDFFIPGVPLEKLRASALRIQGGGVGYYPASGSPFVHLDVGNIRHWPRMTRDQLAKVFPDGRTVHVPADGTPLPGYELALADLERGVNQRTATPPKQRSLFASLFGGAQDAEESSDNASARQNIVAARSATPRPAAPARALVAAVAEPAADNTPVPLPVRRPIYQVAAADSRPAPAPATRSVALFDLASLSPNEIVNMRGYWGDVTETPPKPAQVAQSPADSISSARRVLASSLTAANGIEVTASIGPFAVPDRVPPEVALAYAAQASTSGSRRVPDSRPSSDSRPAPMGRLIESSPAIVTTKGAVSIARKQIETVSPSYPARSVDRMNDRLNDPWLRGLMLASSVQNSLVVTRIGDLDVTTLIQYMRKPDSAMVMTFANNPHLGITAEAFTGSAVVFQATVTFGSQRTAGLQ